MSNIKKAITLSSSEAIKQYISHSDCLACLSEIITNHSENTNRYKVLEIQDLDLRRNLYKLLHKKKYHTALTKTFCDFIEENLK